MAILDFGYWQGCKDASGEPYPILHLKLGGIMKIENWGLVPLF